MAIETAGQQKYADLTAKRIKSLQTGIIAVSYTHLYGEYSVDLSASDAGSGN